MASEIQALAWDRHNSVAGLNGLMVSQQCPLDNWVFNGNAYIKKLLKKTCTD